MYDLQAFIAQYRGHKVEADGSAIGSDTYAQCVDLAKLWARLNGKPVVVGNAINWAKANGYVWVANSANNKPSAGDLVVFNIGQYGHISIATDDSTVRNLVSFDQNWPVGSACQLITHYNYGSVLGWLKIGESGTKTATITKAVANVRSKATTSSAITSVLYKGDSFSYTDTVSNGEGIWLHSTLGHYVNADSGVTY